MDEKCIQKQIIKLCNNYSKQTGSEFKNYYDPDFLKWLEKINPTEPDKNKRVYTYIETPTNFNNEKKIHVCKTCNNRTDFNRIEIPYACKLLFQELITMNIAPRIITE